MKKLSREVIWKPIPGFAGYEVNPIGDIRSWRGPGRGLMLNHCRPMKHDVHKDGYHMVQLHSNDGSYKGMYVHRAVLLAFVGSCPDGMEGCHRDGDRGNNDLDNLRLDTRSNNQFDAVRHGTHAGFKRKGSKHPLAIFTEDQVSEIKRWIVYGLHEKEIATAFSVNRSAIANIRLRKRWPHVAWPDLGVTLS